MQKSLSVDLPSLLCGWLSRGHQEKSTECFRQVPGSERRAAKYWSRELICSRAILKLENRRNVAVPSCSIIQALLVDWLEYQSTGQATERLGHCQEVETSVDIHARLNNRNFDEH